MSQQQDVGGSDGTGGGRPTAASLIAELWSEREQSSALGAPPTALQAGSGAGRPGPGRGPSRTGLVVAVVAAALVLGGGVGVFVATQGIGLPSKAKFVAKADKVCGPANGGLTAMAKPTSYPELATAAGTLVTATDAQLDGLRIVKLPGGASRGRAGAVLTAITETNVAGRQLQDAAGRKDDAATAAAAQRIRSTATDASANAKELGLTACGVGMQPGVEAVVGGANGVVKTAFVAKADGLCRAGARDMDKIREPRDDLKDTTRYINEMLQMSEKLVTDLEAIPIPPGDEAVVADTMSALAKGNDKMRETRDAILADDMSRLVAIEQEITVLATSTDAKLDAYGLTTCGSNFGSR